MSVLHNSTVPTTVIASASTTSLDDPDDHSPSSVISSTSHSMSSMNSTTMTSVIQTMNSSSSAFHTHPGLNSTSSSHPSESTAMALAGYKNSTSLSSSSPSIPTLATSTSSDKAISDKATSDKTTSDKATSDKATSDKATSIKTTSFKTTSGCTTTTAYISSSSLTTTLTETTEEIGKSPMPTSYPTSTIYSQPETYYYTQDYYITDSDTSFTTSVQTMTVMDSQETYTPTSQDVITTDISFLNNMNAYRTGDSSKSTAHNSPKTIAGSVVGAICGAFIVLLVCWWLWRRHQQSVSRSEKGFSHTIASTRRYDEDLFHDAEKSVGKKKSPFSLSWFIPSFKRSSSNGSMDSSTSSGTGLGSLRSSILQDQESLQLNRYTIPSCAQRQRTQEYQTRTIDTVVEENESSSPTTSRKYGNRHNQSYKSTRLQNPMVLQSVQWNPFEDTTRRHPPPVPPTRRANAVPASDYHRHGNNRHSVTSVESSFLSDSTDEGSDESLLLNETGQGNGGFFREIV